MEYIEKYLQVGKHVRHTRALTWIQYITWRWFPKTVVSITYVVGKMNNNGTQRKLG